MKKRTLANLVMVALIAAIGVGGIGLALGLRDRLPGDLGTAFSAPALEDAALSLPKAAGQCTLSIRCDTVLENTRSLADEKIPYVPADGVILPPTTLDIAPGETAFTLLQRVCQAGQIPLEYSWTPLYDSYYVEGIAHLYEFDCGAQSGWMYQVNGAFPNYGCSGYALTGGEAIVWCYTCAGLGTDIPPV